MLAGCSPCLEPASSGFTSDVAPNSFGGGGQNRARFECLAPYSVRVMSGTARESKSQSAGSRQLGLSGEVHSTCLGPKSVQTDPVQKACGEGGDVGSNFSLQDQSGGQPPQSKAAALQPELRAERPVSPEVDVTTERQNSFCHELARASVPSAISNPRSSVSIRGSSLALALPESRQSRPRFSIAWTTRIAYIRAVATESRL